MPIDIQVSLYFEVRNAEIFGGAGSVGYTSVSYGHCTGMGEILGNADKEAELIAGAVNTTAKLMEVSPECVKVIPYDEYEAQTEDDDLEEDDYEDY